MAPGVHRFPATVEFDEERYTRGAEIEGVPDTAYDFGACMRNVLRGMPIPEKPFREGMETLKHRRELAKPAQRSLVSSPVVVVVGVTIIVSEIVIEAGAYTILFAVTVKVVDKAKDDVMEAVRRRPKPNMNRCLDAAAGGEYLWAKLCRALSGVKAAQCWKHANSNETEKRNLCNAWFGN